MATGCETSVTQGKSVLKTYTVQSMTTDVTWKPTQRSSRLLMLCGNLHSAMVTNAVWTPTQHSPWLPMLRGNQQSAAHGY